MVDFTAQGYLTGKPQTQGLSVVLFGDSLTAYNNLPVSIGGIVGDGTTSLVTCGSSPVTDGSTVLITATGSTFFDKQFFTATGVDVNTFSIPNAFNGALGAIGAATLHDWECERGYWTMAAMIMGHKLRRVFNAGIGGDTLFAARSRVFRDVISKKPSHVVLMMGINDIASGFTASQILGFYDDFYNQVLNAGIVPVGLTILPLASTHANFATSTPIILQTNQLHREYGRSRGIQVIDTFGEAVDTAQSDGRAIAAYFASDGIHPNTVCARVLGIKIANSLLSLPSPQLYSTNQADSFGVNANNRNLADQSPWATVGGTVTAPMTGVMPTGFTFARSSGAGAGAGSVVARTLVSDGDTVGNNAVLTLTPAADGDAYTLTLTPDITPRTIAGRSYQVSAQMRLVGTAGSTLKRIRFQNLLLPPSGVRAAITAGLSNDVTVINSANYDDRTYHIRFPRFKMPSWCTNGFAPVLTLIFGGVGGALTVNVGRVTVELLND